MRRETLVSAISMRCLAAALALVHVGDVLAQGRAVDKPFVFEARNKTLDNGTRYSMELREISSDERSSLVELSVDHGSREAMQIVLFRGICALMRARGRDYGELIRSESTDTRMRIVFPSVVTAADERDRDRMILTRNMCLMVEERQK
jgi:hypothetical protein